MAIPEKTLQLINEGNYEINIGKYVSEGFALVQKKIGLFIAFGVILALAQMMGQIPVIGILIALFLTPAINAGGYYASEIVDKGERELEFGDFFKGFENLGQLIALTIILGLIIFAVMIPGLVLLGFGIFINMDDPSIPMIVLGAILFSIPVIYLAICYAFSVLFLVLEKLTFWDALEASRQLISKNWFNFFLLFLVIGLIAMSGMLLFLVGLVFTLPASFAISYVAFKDITGYGQERDEEDDILLHLIEE